MGQLALVGTDGGWGVSGPMFLLCYAALACALLLAALTARHAMTTRRPPGHDIRSLDAHRVVDPYLVGYLGGGEEQALLAALSSLCSAGLVHSREHRFERADGPVTTRQAPLTEAVLAETAAPVSRAQLLTRQPVRAALDELHDDLVQRHMLVADDRQRSYRRWGFAMLVLLELGVLRLVTTVPTDGSVGYLAAALAVVAVLTSVLLCTIPRRSALGDSELYRLRAEHQHLAPSICLDATTYGAGAVALAVALFGPSVLRTADPAFADELLGMRVDPAAGRALTERMPWFGAGIGGG